MNRSEVQAPAALTPKAMMPGRVSANPAADKKTANVVTAPVGSIASLESRLGF
ncbi:hypothetical protein [Ancylobacter radicis]|uniref:Uncharacterized protein n=1 Tax=Ancylobacter radicis TaxID=2836179 RepID=A0ABS5RAC6_9HYPH|nr:hypothetical protein [Ancylobacter radicis]MBS9478624.1 hypothetical protein [Ancylobacter radicis]